jgi:soluble lytic murein transglycosylase
MNYSGSGGAPSSADCTGASERPADSAAYNPTMRRPILLMLCCVFLATSGAARADAAAEADLAQAREAAQRGQPRPLEAWKARYPGHPLEAYATFWLLSGSVDRADPAAVRDFLTRHADTPLADLIRREWLRSLGAAAQWEAFRAEHPRVIAEDPELACLSFQERLARGDAEAAAEARAAFLAAREAPSACEPVFAALVGKGAISEADTWARMRKLLAANQLREARRTDQWLPKRQRLNEKLLERAAADPAGFLARQKSPVLTHSVRELAVYAIGRLARVRPDEAAERIARLGDGADERYAWGQVAWQAAMSHHPRALEWYGRAGDAQLSDVQVAWKARAAMRAGDWKEVFAAIRRLSPEVAREPAWRYWRARALRALGEPEAADALLRGLAGERNFYGILAAEQVGGAWLPDWNGWRPQQSDLDRVMGVPALRRALALYRLGYEGEALREWLWATRGMEDRDLLAAAELARLAGVPDRAINTANRTVQLHDFAQRFPTPHREAVSASSQQWGLDEALMYSLIRQESRFMAHARSRVGATGLMQLMPATAKWVAGQIPVEPYHKEMLVEPTLNVRMGTYYFSRVLADLGHPVLAAAAYNAGPGRARRWRDAQPIEGAIYVETIPFNETRDYVKQVFTNLWFYSHRLTGQAPSLRQVVGTVPGRNGDGAESALAAVIP